MCSLALLHLPPFTFLVVLTLFTHTHFRKVLARPHFFIDAVSFPVHKKVSQKRGGGSLCTPKMKYIPYYGNFTSSKLTIFCTAANTFCHLKHPHSSDIVNCLSEVPQTFLYLKTIFIIFHYTRAAETEVFNLEYRTVEKLLLFHLLG